MPHTQNSGQTRVDNFNGLRLLAAGMVLVGHVLTEFAPWGAVISHPGLLILFTISGYLVAGSWRADPDLFRFLLRRFLRIWPALACMVITCAALGHSTRPGDAVLFLRNLWFEFHPVGFNGSIWMLPIEVSLYVLLALAAHGAAWALFATVGWAAWMTQAFGIGWLSFGMFFVAGVLMQAYPTSDRRALLLLVGAGLGLAIGNTEVGYLLAIPTLVVGVGRRSWPVLRAAAHHGDFSYGLFLWHAPWLHFVVLPLGLGPVQSVALTFAATLACAAVSWHLIERRFLALKPGRRSDSRTL